MTEQDRITLGIADASRTLGVSRSTLCVLIASGEIESVKIGKRRLIPRRALETFVARKQREQGRAAA